ncbi:hypothetical protein AWL63_18575 [Sphingomonas panacis]|uniref:HTH marR-type domain-containing protein n=1 Tax=Sphingomonas panacis TaxID=1560345 RepID=A0A1B3ZHP8_9SPHN|nr:hypothetical protein AWL63_18575 [Sphingomonas panacis]
MLEQLAGLRSNQSYEAGVQIANLWLMALRLRQVIFGNDLFADPAWDMLLDLHSAEARNEKVKITSLSAMARVPSSTSCRWARILTQKGLIVREKDPVDKRRVYVRLSPDARQLMRVYFDTLLEKGTHNTSS